MENAYIETGLQAATYKDKILGYPFYFETSALLYNKTYLEDMAKKLLEEEGNQAAAEAAEQIDAKVQEILPATIEDIKNFADEYDAPEQVEGVFKWDVTDIFYNYFFVGNAINMGGEAGWDTTQIDIYNLDAIKNLRVYQELNQFFSIDTSKSSYDAILDEFMAGKMVFTIATTDAVYKLENAKSEGLFAYDYGITLTPDIDEEIKSRSLSMTNCVVVNGYSENKKAANDFASFLTTQYNDSLYTRSDKVSAAKEVSYEYAALNEFASEYEESVSMPKMVETSNFWVQLEVAFSQIWNGADANEKLKGLSEQIMSQVTGETYEEEYLEEPKEQEEETEYLDEEYYRQEAMEEE